MRREFSSMQRGPSKEEKELFMWSQE